MSRTGITPSGLAASAVLTLTSAEGKKIDYELLLTILLKLLEAPHASAKTHPIFLASCSAGIVHFNEDFVHFAAACVDQLHCEKTPGNFVSLELNHKMQLRALFTFFHVDSHKKKVGVNVIRACLLEHKVFCNSHYNPAQEIVPWGLMVSKNKGLVNWNKLVKPNARDFKPFCESDNWVEHKDHFLVTLEAQNLTHLTDKIQSH